MKKLTLLLVVLLTGLLITSCNKPSPEPSNPPGDSKINNVSLLSDPEYRQALLNTLTTYASQNPATRGAEFLPVFYTPQGFGFFDETYTKLVTFSALPDENDFIRLNPDGTYTVHMVSDEAFSELVDYMSGEYYSGTGGQMIMNYSGPVQLIPIPDGQGNIIGYIYYVIYPNDVSPATVWHGHGPVQLYGMGPEMNLVGKLTASAKWKNVKTIVKLD